MSASYKYTPEQGLRYAGNLQLTITIRNRHVLLEGEPNFRRVQIRRCVRKQLVCTKEATNVTGGDEWKNHYWTLNQERKVCSVFLGRGGSIRWKEHAQHSAVQWQGVGTICRKKFCCKRIFVKKIFV